MEEKFVDKTNDISHQLNCKDCGALLLYSPGAQKLAYQKKKLKLKKRITTTSSIIKFNKKKNKL